MMGSARCESSTAITATTWFSSRTRTASSAATCWRFCPISWRSASLDPEGGETWHSPHPAAERRTYRLCANYSGAQVCNWAVDARHGETLCEACRLTTTIPDLAVEGNQAAWYKLEVAKRRLVYTLLSLRLPIVPRSQDPRGLAFEFLADAADGPPTVLTGHTGGVITISLAEADDAERERRRHALGEPYRTLLGHVRHEAGHYYWDRLIAGTDRHDAFRALFGDERDDYQAALQRHYAGGPPADWQARFVTAYASVHPWEDWAETWAHYLHITDTLETAAACGVSIRPRRRDEPTLTQVPSSAGTLASPFDRLIDELVSGDLSAQQPQSRPGHHRRLSVRPVAAGGRETPLRARHDRARLVRPAGGRGVRNRHSVSSV